MDAAGGHRVERRGDHRARLVGAVADVRAAQEVDRHRLRELRRAAEASVRAVRTATRMPAKARSRIVVRRGRASGRRCAGPPRRARPVSCSLCGEHVVAPFAPRLRHRGAHAPERRHAVPVGVGEVRARVERPAVGRAPHAHRPAAAAGQRLHRLHVDRVDVGALLAVDLHVDEALVHERGGVGILERLVRHHVAPVARRVADRQEHGHVAFARERERLVAPRHPVDGVVGVLAEVRARLVGEPVLGHASTVPGARCRRPSRAHR